MNLDLLQKAANQARGLAMDAVHDCASGHLGLPLGCAEIGAVLFGDLLNICPTQPRWLNRDRFILSAGHGSMFLYGWLHLSGFNISIEDLKGFRHKGSITPGHPEFRDTEGVECTTGPLGQGIANAVGFALSARRAAARFNRPGMDIFTQHVFCLTGDGCLQEGVARESIALAAVLKLDNLILIYDSNDITLDAPADRTQIADPRAMYEALGWDVRQIDGHDLKAIAEAVEAAKAAKNGKPQLIIAKTVIGKGIPGIEGTTKGHGEGGAKLQEEAHANWGIPAGERYYVSEDVRSFFNGLRAGREAAFTAWEAMYRKWRATYPELAAELDSGMDACARGVDAAITDKDISPFPADYSDATRSAGSVAINAVAKAAPWFLTTSADLYSSNKNYLSGAGDFSAENPEGRNFWFGIREHAMAAICNGMAYDGLFRVSAATFCVFVDYMRGAIRVAALSGLPVTYILTHDSVAVGEDGPTHQPVETVSGLRVIPNLDVIRPADPEETAGAWMAALQRAEGPTALILTRQKVATLNDIPVETRRQGVLKGGYIARREQGELKAVIMASGSELELALKAAEQVGEGIRVVSMPSFFRFDAQPAEYRESVIPSSCVKRVSVEAGVTDLWWKYLGCQGEAVGINRFGFSAPGAQVLEELGMNVDNVVAAVQKVLAK
ncbi:transketolase [Akkermansia sp.]|uniref:transketolase n=1 Tax=Akkermansia sp. TaxID=1872421 RepID=UPI0025BC448C|nr:transketolase [Akkermansia sp.]